MPRQARLDYKGCLHHIMNRGIEKRTIFSDRGDYEYFIKILGELIQKGGHKCYAWVLMPNHFHLLVETGKESISRLMSRVSTRYAGYYNNKYERAGRLFQNRFKSIVCQKDSYFVKLVTYIHLNPLRAGLVKGLDRLDEYKWSGHSVIMGKRKLEWQSVEHALSWFGDKRKNYLSKLRESYMEKLNYSGGGVVSSKGAFKLVKTQKEELNKFYTRILGSEEFVGEILESRSNDNESESDKKYKRLPNMDTKEIVSKLAELNKVDIKEVFKKGRTNRSGMEVRALAVFLAVKYKNESMTDLSDLFEISQPAVSKLYRIGEGIKEKTGTLIAI